VLEENSFFGGKKMKKIKKLVLLVLSICIISTVVGCNKGSKENNAKETAKKNIKIEPLMKYEEPINMFVGQFVANEKAFPQGEDPENNGAYKVFEEQIGIKFIPKFIAPYGDGYRQKLRMAIVGNDLPDISTATTDELDLMIKGDMIEDLTEYYNKYATENLKKMFSYRNDIAFSAVKRDGKIYALPQVTDANNGVPMVYIRKDWLEKSGKAVPKSMEELLELARYFTKNDPDGNGKDDTLGIAFSKELAIPFNGIMNAFGAYPGIYVKGNDGKLQYGSLQPEVKEVLGKLNELYKEGVLDKEFAVKDGNKMAEAVASGKVGIYFGEFWNPLWPLNDTIKNDSNADWLPIGVPGGDGKTFVPYVPLNVNGYVFVRKGYAHPEALIIAMNHWAEGFTNPNASFAKAWSELGKQEKYKGVMLHSFLPFAFDRIDKNVQYSDNLIDAIKKNDPSSLPSPDEKDLYEKIKKGGVENWAWATIYQQSMQVVKGYKDFKYNEFLKSPTETMLQKQAVLQKLELETYTGIIVGAKNLSAFDDFVKQYNELGGKQILDELNSEK
jgi:putative aldouronate transport system substrate-binding protein